MVARDLGASGALASNARRSAAPARAPGVGRIAVFRALQLGDLLCAVPALRALRHGFPDARITLIGLPSAGDFVRRFGRYVDDWLEFPGIAALPEQPAREEQLPAFFARARAMRFDLALQMHGSGERTNSIVRLLGAQRNVAFGLAPHRPAPNDIVPWPEEGHEIERLLLITDHLGLPRRGVELELPIDELERRRWARLAHRRALDPRRLVLVHPGSRLASRRWPAQRYAALSDRLSALGWQIAITGTLEERAIVDAVLGAMRSPAADLCGCTTLGELAAAIESCRLLICNDTSVSHVASAVGTRSVVIASGSEITRWRPLNRALHSVLAADLPCRPCADAVCRFEDHPCATAIDVERVFELALHHLLPASLPEHA